METIELTNEFLGMDSEAPGLHRRLLAGLRSVLDRNGDPQYRIEPGDKAMRPYRDYDLVMVMRSGAGEGRRVDGEMRWPLHVGNSGRTSAKGLYTLPSLDLVVWSSDGNEATRFVGEVIAKWADQRSLGDEVSHRLRLIAERASFSEVVADYERESATSKEVAAPIDYEPSTDQIKITGRRRPWGPHARRYEESRREVTGWGAYTHLVTMVDTNTLAWDAPRYWLVGPAEGDET